MSVLVSMSSCPNCGASISSRGESRYAICIFCNTSLTLSSEHGSGSAPAPSFTAQPMAREDVDRVKQLLVDGRRDEAIALYANLAAVPRDEAARAMENVFLSSQTEIMRHLPIGLFGVFFHLTWVALSAGVAAWGAVNLGESLAYLAPLVLGGLLAAYRLFMFARHLRATYVSKLGARGRGRVVRRAIIREDKAKDEFFIVVVVRFSGGRSHVYPISPVTVIG